MTAESLERTRQPDIILLQAVGSVAMQRQSTENVDRQAPDTVVDLPPAATAEGANARKFGIAASLIKEKFQGIAANLKADERDAERDKAREDSIRTLFKTFEMLPRTDAINEPFSKLYRAVEASMPDRDKSHIGDLTHTYAGHPVIMVFDKLQEVAAISRDDWVFMRRISLVLIDEHTVQPA